MDYQLARRKSKNQHREAPSRDRGRRAVSAPLRGTDGGKNLDFGDSRQADRQAREGTGRRDGEGDSTLTVRPCELLGIRCVWYGRQRGGRGRRLWERDAGLKRCREGEREGGSSQSFCGLKGETKS